MNFHNIMKLILFCFGIAFAFPTPTSKVQQSQVSLKPNDLSIESGKIFEGHFDSLFDSGLHKRQYFISLFDPAKVEKKLQFLMTNLTEHLSSKTSNFSAFELHLPQLRKTILEIRERLDSVAPFPDLMGQLNLAATIIDEFLNAIRDLKIYSSSTVLGSSFICEAIENQLSALSLNAENGYGNIVVDDYEIRFMVLWREITSLETRFKATGGIPATTHFDFKKIQANSQKILDRLGKNIRGYAK